MGSCCGTCVVLRVIVEVKCLRNYPEVARTDMFLEGVEGVGVTQNQKYNGLYCGVYSRANRSDKDDRWFEYSRVTGTLRP